MKQFLEWVVEADSASSQYVAAVLGTKAESRRAKKNGAIIAITDDSLLRKARTKQVGQVLRASTAVQKYAVSEVCVAQWFLHCFARGPFSQFF